MSHYFRKMFPKPQNLRKLHRTVSGLDKDHIKTGNYLYQHFKKNHLPEIVESLRLLNIFGPGSMHGHNTTEFVDIWSGGVWGGVKTQHPSYQKPSDLSVLAKENSLPPASQKS